MRILKYMIFLVSVLAFMVFLGHKETLTVDETLAIAEFEKQEILLQQAPIAAASENPLPGNTSGTPSVDGTTPPHTETVLTRTIPNGTVLEDSVNVRSGPGLDFPVVTQLYKGDQVIVGENINGWYELQLNGRRFFVSAEWVSVSPTQ